ncbi:MAG: MATE family efflux transporter, partial [Elusimicrobiaceae bacterium]
GISAGQEGGMRELWKLTYPLVLSTASATVMQFVNRMFLAWYGPQELAAVVPAGLMAFSCICFFLGTTSYTNVFISQFYGGKKYANLSVALWQGVWLSLFSWIIIAACIVPGIMLINMSGHTAAIKELEKQYFVIVTAAGGLVPLNAAFSAFFTGRGKTKITMCVQMLMNAVNVVFSYVLIFGKFGFPALGIRGGAYAFVIGNIVGAAVFLSIILNKAHRTEYRTARLFHFHYKLFKKLVAFGIPNGVGFLLDIASFTVFVFLAGNMSPETLEANNIILTINMLAFMPILGVGMAVETLVGQYIGAGKPHIARKIAHSGLKMAALYSLPMAFIFFFAPGPIIKPFTLSNPAGMAQTVAICYSILKILCVFIVADMVAIIYSNVIRGGGDTKFQMVTASACAWLVFVPGLYWLNKTHHSITAMWWWGSFYLSLTALVYALRYRHGNWLKLKLVHRARNS